MTKAEFVGAVAEKAGLKKVEAEKAVEAFLATVQEGLVAGDKISFVGFGSFEVAQRAAKKGINPQSKAQITIAATQVPKFKPGKSLKEAVAAAKKK